MMRHAETTQATNTEPPPMRGAWLMLGTITASLALMAAVVIRAALDVEASVLLPAMAAIVIALGCGLVIGGVSMRASPFRGVNAVQTVGRRVPTKPMVAVALSSVVATTWLVA